MALSAAERSPDLVRPNMGIDSDVDPPYESERKSIPAGIRIVLLGKTGAGKSAAGNTILGQKEFRSELNVHSVTRECSEGHATVSGRSVTVVDTPGFFDTHMNPEELMTEMARSVYLSSPGPHAFLIVCPVNMRYTEQEQQVLQQTEMMFGEEVLKYSIILFTHGDLLKGISIQRIIEENQALRHVVDQCGGRFHVFNNKDVNNRKQVNDLLQKIDTMIEQNRGGYYSNQMFEDAQILRPFAKTLIKRKNVSSRLADECEAIRYHVLNNKTKRNREQVNDLLQKIDTKIEQNDGYYNNQMLGDAKRFRREKREWKQQKGEQWKQQNEKQSNEEIGRMINKIGAALEAQKWLEADRRKTKIQSDFEEAMRKPFHWLLSKHQKHLI